MKEVMKNGKNGSASYSGVFLALLIQIFYQPYLTGSDIKNNLI